jgi:iron complex outermembrane receptor protein
MHNNNHQSKINSGVKPIVSAVALALLAFMEPSYAQQAAEPAAPATAAPAAAPADAAPAAADSDEPQLQRIVVSANKRIEKLENVPMAISVMTDAVIKRNNIVELNDVINLQPALTMTFGTTPANNGINMRGVGTSSIGVGVESDVVTVIDDIPSSGVQFKALTDLSDVTRIEILKGPQSTLFGKAAIAGAINIVTTPISGPIQSSGQSYYTTDHEWRLGGAVGGEIDDHWGFRISALDERFPGNVTNLAGDGSTTDGYGGRTFMSKVKWTPTDNLTFDLSGHFNHEIDDCCVYVLKSMPMAGSYYMGQSKNPALAASVLEAGITPSNDNTTVNNGAFTGLESTDRGLGLKTTLDLPNGRKLMLISSDDVYRANDSRDQDFTSGNILGNLPIVAPSNGQPLIAGSKVGQLASTVGAFGDYTQTGTYDVRSSTEELRLVSSDEGTFKYVAGLFYGKNSIIRDFTRGIYETATTPIAYDAGTFNINHAIFGQATWEFVPTWTVLAGVRYNREISGYSMAFYNPFTGPQGPAGLIPCPTIKSVGCGFQGNGVPGGLNPDGNADDAVTGKLSLQHQLTQELMVYGLLSDGYKGKAYDVTSGMGPLENAFDPVPAETSRNEELGLKANLLHNRVTVSAAIFNTNFRNYQQSSTITLPDGTTESVLNSVPKVNSHGFEIDSSALVTKYLALDIGFAYTQATIKEWNNAPCYPGETANGSVAGTCINNGVLPQAPARKINVGGQYDIPLANRSFDEFVSFDTRAQSSVYTNINQDPTLTLPGYSITNIGYGIKDKNKKYTVTFFVDNLFDRQYATGGIGGFGSAFKTGSSTTPSTSWTPARDAFRYGGVRLDMKF